MGRFHSWRGAFVLVASLASASAIAMEAYLECDPQYARQIGNGYCDVGSNTEACGYDGGDCCGCTCQDSENFFECGINGYNCLDPDTACADLVEIETARDLMEAISFTTMTPSSSPTASPSSHPTSNPTSNPTSSPTSTPTSSPTSSPTSTPSSIPGIAPNDPRGAPGAGIGTTTTSSKGGLLSGFTGIVISVIVLAVIILLIVCVWRKRRSFSGDATDEYAPPGPMQYA